MSTITKGSKFPSQIAEEMFNAVTGHSTLAKLSQARPIAFNGTDFFTFSFSSKLAVVGESGQKPAGDGAVGSVPVKPVKVVYQARVSDEFLYASDEARLPILKEFAAGFAKKLGQGLDEMAFHGVNPATGSAASTTIGNNHFDYVLANYSSGANIVELGHDSSSIDENIEEAIAKVEDAELAVTGIAMAPAARTLMAGLTQNSGERKYPDFAFGGVPASLGAGKLDVNATVSANSSDDRVIVGDFANAFRWGFAKELPIEIIEYGDPDGAGDLKNTNEVVIRSEAYIGWGILNAASFAMVAVGE